LHHWKNHLIYRFMNKIECPECDCSNPPGFNTLSKIHKIPWTGTDKNDRLITEKPDFCQTCLKLRLEDLERLFKEKDQP
jgi:hypothetical protein